jgi:hypothetical protein
MPMQPQFDKDKHPEGLVIGDEVRECGPIDPNYDAESELEQRLAKQTEPTSLGRSAPGQKVATWAERKEK